MVVVADTGPSSRADDCCETLELPYHVYYNQTHHHGSDAFGDFFAHDVPFSLNDSPVYKSSSTMRT